MIQEELVLRFLTLQVCLEGLKVVGQIQSLIQVGHHDLAGLSDVFSRFLWLSFRNLNFLIKLSEADSFSMLPQLLSYFNHSVEELFIIVTTASGATRSMRKHPGINLLDEL